MTTIDLKLTLLDWSFVFSFIVLSLFIVIWVTKRASSNSVQFFLSGRTMPWWLLGVSMVATTFSTDTPNLVADITRQNGVSGNWVWWAFLLTGMLTVFLYAKLWCRLGLTTEATLFFNIAHYALRPWILVALASLKAVFQLGVFTNFGIESDI